MLARIQKSLLSTVLVMSLCALSTQGMAQSTKNSNNNIDIDKVVAIVNDDVITESELDQQYKTVKQSLTEKGTRLPSNQQIKRQVLQRLINTKLELQTAKRIGIEIDDDALNKAIKNIAKQHHISQTQLRKDIQKQGLDYAHYRDMIREQMTIDKLLQQEIGGHIYISKDEVETIVKSMQASMKKQGKKQVPEYHVKDILIALPDVPSSKEVQVAKSKADKVAKELKSGADFDKIAIAQSNGEQALKGGDLGWRKKAELPDVFIKYIVNMKPKEIAGPIRTDNGYHIIQLAGVKGTKFSHTVEQTHVRHILMTTDNNHPNKQVKAQLEKMREDIIAGKVSFAELAKKYSKDELSGQKGGDVGWVTPDLLVPTFAKTMQSLKINEISHPIQTRFGWHIVQVTGRRQHDDTEDFQRLQARKYLYQRDFNEKTQSLINRIRKASYIKILDPSLEEKHAS